MDDLHDQLMERSEQLEDRLISDLILIDCFQLHNCVCKMADRYRRFGVYCSIKLQDSPKRVTTLVFPENDEASSPETLLVVLV